MQTSCLKQCRLARSIRPYYNITPFSRSKHSEQERQSDNRHGKSRRGEPILKKIMKSDGTVVSHHRDELWISELFLQTLVRLQFALPFPVLIDAKLGREYFKKPFRVVEGSFLREHNATFFTSPLRDYDPPHAIIDFDL